MEILALGALCGAWALFGLLARRWDPESRECGGCGGGECRRSEGCRRLESLALVLLGLILASGCARPAFQTFSFETMGTRVQVTVPGGAQAAGHADEVARVFREVDARMSEWKETSPLSAVNRGAGGEAVPVPDDLRAVIRRGLDLGRRTDGAFDVTWAALWGLWDFRSPSPRVPEAAEIARRVALVDYRRVEVDDRAGTVRLPTPGMKIGLGGIAKGYALDRAGAVLRERGVRDFLILGGGQILAGGSRGGRPWRAGLRDPRGGPEEEFARLDLRDESLSTSGDYENCFLVGEKRYHHILDPRTGWPSEGVRGATVVSSDATLADAMSTACMVLGAERSLEACRQVGVEAVLVDGAGQVHVTPGLEKRLERLRDPRP